MTSRRRGNGVGLVQLLAAVAAFLSLAFGVPAWFAVRINNARVGRAERDVRTIAEAVQRFDRDNGHLPGRPGAGPEARRTGEDVDLLIGPGEIPKVSDTAGPGWRSLRTGAFTTQLLGREPTADPWGSRYTVTVGWPDTWVLSAGPNGVVETASSASGRPPQSTLSGDDVGIRIGPRGDNH